MNQIYPDEGLVTLLQQLVADDVEYHLFVNDEVIDRDTVLADLTEESTHGYAALTVPAADFGISGVTAHVGSLLALPISFTPAGGDWTLYGYYVTLPGGTELLWAGRFDDAPVTVLDGEPILLTPVVADFSKLAS